MAGIVKHQNVKVIAEKATSNHETHFLQLNDQLELKTSDDDLLTQLQTIDGNIVDVEGILNSQTTELQAIKTNQLWINNKVKLGSSKSLGVIGGESTPIADPDENEGWLFKKLANDATKINLYFYSQGNNALTLDDLQTIKATVNIGNYQNDASLPFFIVYTKPTGVNDAGVWYHSKETYTISPNINIILGETIEIYGGTLPNKSNSNKRQVAFNTKTTDGEGLLTEEILTIALHTDSGALLNTEILVKNMCFIMEKNGVKIENNTKLIT